LVELSEERTAEVIWNFLKGGTGEGEVTVVWRAKKCQFMDRWLWWAGELPRWLCSKQNRGIRVIDSIDRWLKKKVEKDQIGGARLINNAISDRWSQNWRYLGGWGVSWGCEMYGKRSRFIILSGRCET
jgi:hypothetical protein